MRCFVLLCLTCLAARVLASDYLPDDLRSRVEQLKRATQATPTNPANAKARAQTLWQWLNAYALNDGYIPVNATQMIAGVLSGVPISPRLMQALDDAIAEFTFLDEQPDGLGVLRAELGPYIADTQATIKQTYRVGARAIQTGGGFVVAKHFMAPFGAWQTNDPEAAGYITISSSNQNVNFVADNVPVAGMHGGFRAPAPRLMFRLTSGTLQPEDEVTITYGGGSGPQAGVSVPRFASDRMPLPLYLKFHEQGLMFSLPIQPLRVIGQQIAGVRGFAPSVVAPGEDFKLSVRAEDRFINRAKGTVPDWQLYLNDEPWLQLPATGALTETQASIDKAGIYFPTIKSADGRFEGSINPILVTVQDTARIYWGDTHGHSGFAEGVGTPEQFMRWAREDARLDYVTHSEHDIWLDDFEWQRLKDNVTDFSTPGEFIAYLGYEWTVRNPRGGHHNVLFRDLDNRSRIGAQFYPTLSSLYQGLRTHYDSEDVVVIPHAHNSGDFRLSDPELQPLVEIMSQHGNFEWFGRMYLKNGHQIGFTAASDNHLSQPGYSFPMAGALSQRGGLGALLAQELSRDALFNAMRTLRSYATTGDRMILEFSVNDVGMGQRAPFAQERQIRGRIIGTAPIDEITLFKNDEILWQQHYMRADTSSLPREMTLRLSFNSSATPDSLRDNPRGWRPWRGTVSVTNARLRSAAALDNKYPRQLANIVAENQFELATETRGAASSFLVTLEEVGRNTRLSIALDDAIEQGAAPPRYRAHQRIPATTIELALKDLNQGVISTQQTVDSYLDTVRLEHINTDGQKVIAFEVEDADHRHGDYYFVRVVQSNDAIAWSSPVWIGGSPPQ